MTRTRRTLMVGTASVAALVLSGCALSTQSIGGAPSASTSRTVPSLSTSVPGVTVGFCMDPSDAEPLAASRAVLSTLADLSAQWVPATAPATTPAIPAAPSLRVVVRTVSTSSYGSGQILNMTVPAVPGVAVAPSDPTDLPWTQSVLSERERLVKARPGEVNAAVSAERSLANGLHSVNPPASYSDISGCLSALVQTVAGTNPRIIVASDLAQNEPPQLAGSLAGAAVLIAHVCNDAQICQAQEMAWTRLFSSVWHATPQFIRSENIPTVVPGFVRGMTS